MNKFKFYFILSITSLSLFSCSKNNPAGEVAPLRDFAVQYTTDITDIEEYLKTYYIEDISADADTKITKIPEGGTQASIWSYKDNANFPKLLSRNVELHDITYKLYYLVLREGSGASPCNVDGVLTSYKGEYLEQIVTADVAALTVSGFEEVKYPQQMINLFSRERGWKEIFPQFKTGSYSANADGTVSYADFGAGVMFIPSGLAYYSSGNASVPAYAPIVVSFKLYEIQRLDHEYNIASGAPTPDGIMSYQEDLDGDGYVWTAGELPTGAINPDDTDGDGIPDFLDVDDDGDGIGTKSEITNANGAIIPFADIPSCDGNTTDATRIKKHLDKSCN